MMSTSTSSLPNYSPPIATPSYSTLPLPDERTIEYNARGGSSSAQGNVVRKWRKATIILKGQDETNSLPTYGRNSVITGEVGVVEDARWRSVAIKLEGRLNLSIADGGTSSITIVSEKRVLWKMHEDDPTLRCPSILPFALRFPASYEDGVRTRKLPPSYETLFTGIPALHARCSYTLSLIITRAHSRISFWKPTTTYSIRLTYRPRTRPSRPVLQIHPFFSSIKPLPEEWRQIVAHMRSKPSYGLDNIHCHFLIPSVQTFGLSDSIPFHIQLVAPLSVLRHFVPPMPDPSSSSSDSLSSSPTQKIKSVSTVPTVPQPSLRVFLARQISVEVNGRHTWRNSILGEGTTRPVAPHASSTCERHAAEDVSADWEGEVRCRDDVTCGGFDIKGLIVKDFIVFALTPPNPRASPLLQMQHAHAIKLVTDTWTDNDTSHPHDF